jgi:hypothetical protein
MEQEKNEYERKKHFRTIRSYKAKRQLVNNYNKKRLFSVNNRA